MLRSFALASMLAAATLSACATKPADRPINASLVLWPKDLGADCDFDRPARERARAVGYSPTPRSAALQGRLPISQSYSVRNAQMRDRPGVGEVFCLVLSRGRATERAEAVIGFEVTAVSHEYLEIVPRSARVDRSAAGTSNQVALQVAFASGLYQPGGSELASSAQFDLGVIPTDGRVIDRTMPAQRLRWPSAPSDSDILRIGAVVMESSPGSADAIGAEDLVATLSAAR